MNNRQAVEAVIADKLCWPDQVPQTVNGIIALLDEKDKEIVNLREALEELGAPVEPDAMCAKLVECGTFTAQAVTPTIRIGKALYSDLRRDRRRAEWAFENTGFQKVGDSYEITTEECDYIRGSWREAVDDAMADARRKGTD